MEGPQLIAVTVLQISAGAAERMQSVGDHTGDKGLNSE